MVGTAGSDVWLFTGRSMSLILGIAALGRGPFDCDSGPRRATLCGRAARLVPLDSASIGE